MPISVGEVEAVLSARDNMTPAMQLAAAKVADLEYRLGTLGVSSVNTFNLMNAQLAVAKERLDNLTNGNESWGQSMIGVEGIAMRLIERMVILYAVRETFTFVKDLFVAADALVKVSTSTDVSIQKLQELQYAADMLGIPFTKVTSSLDALDKKLSQNKLTTEDALESIGLSFSKIFAMTPDQRLEAIYAAIAKIPDALTRSKVEMELFGTDGLDPLIRRHNELAKAAENSNKVLGDDTIHALANTVTMYRGFWTDIKPILENLIDFGQRAVAAITFPLFNPAANVPNNVPLPVKSLVPGDTSGIQGLAGGIKVEGDPFNTGPIVDYIDKLKAASTGEKELTDEQIKQMTELKELNLLTADNAAQLTKEGVNLNINTPLYKQFLELQKQKEAGDRAQQTATENYAKAVYELTTAGNGWKGTLDTIDGTVVESIKWAMQAGIANKDLALIYKLNDDQIRAVAKSLADETAQRKLQAAATLEITKLSDQLNEIVGDQGATAWQKQSNAIEKWAADTVARMSKAGTDTNEFYDTLANVVLAKYKAINIDWKAINDAQTNDTKASLQQIADKEKATYLEALKHVGEWSEGTILKFKDTADAAQRAADTWGTAISNAATTGANAVTTSSDTELKAINAVTQGYYAQADAAVAAANAASHGLESTTGTRAPHLENGIWVDGDGKPITSNPTGFSLPGFKLPGFDKGGIVTVGEFGAERVALPQGSMVFPNGSSGGGDVHVAVEMKVSGILDPATIRTLTSETSKQIIKEAKQALQYGSR